MIFRFVLLLTLTLPGYAAPDCEDQAIFRIKKMPAHTVKMPFPTKEAAMTKLRMESPWCQLLNGDWKFSWGARPLPQYQIKPTGTYSWSFRLQGK